MGFVPDQPTSGSRFVPDDPEQQKKLVPLAPPVPAGPRPPVYGNDGQALTDVQLAADEAAKKPTSSEPSTLEYMMDPSKYIASNLRRFGMGETGANMAERDINALQDSLGPLGAEFAPLSAAKDVLTAPQMPRAVRAAPTSAKAGFDEASTRYKQLHSLGPYDPEVLKPIAPEMKSSLEEARMFPEIHKDAYSTADRMGKEFEQFGATPGTLDLWRQVIKRDLLNSSDNHTRASGEVLMDKLDEFVNSGEGGPVAQSAHGLFRKAVQTDRLEFALKQAERVAGRGNANFTGALATQLQKLIAKDELAIQKGKPPQFDEATRKALDRIAANRGGRILDTIGNLSPEKRFSWLLQAVGFGLTGGAHTVVQGALMAGGYAAKKAADEYARRQLLKQMFQLQNK